MFQVFKSNPQFVTNGIITQFVSGYILIDEAGSVYKDSRGFVVVYKKISIAKKEAEWLNR